MTVCSCQQTDIQLLQHFIFCLQWSPIPCQFSFNLSEEFGFSSFFVLLTFPSCHLFSALSSTTSLFIEGFCFKIQYFLWSKLLHAACSLCGLVPLANYPSCYRSYLLLGSCCAVWSRLLMVSVWGKYHLMFKNNISKTFFTCLYSNYIYLQVKLQDQNIHLSIFPSRFLFLTQKLCVCSSNTRIILIHDDS